MQFKPEYMTDELSGILNVVLSYSSDTVYEEYHVVKAIDRCAKELAQTVLKQYRSLTMLQRVNPTLFDTDWYIHSNMEPDRPIEDTFISKEQSNHRIMFSFQKLNPMTDMQNDLRELPYNDVEIENLRTYNFSEDLKTDNPLIIINTAFMDWIRLD